MMERELSKYFHVKLGAVTENASSDAAASTQISSVLDATRSSAIEDGLTTTARAQIGSNFSFPSCSEKLLLSKFRSAIALSETD